MQFQFSSKNIVKSSFRQADQKNPIKVAIANITEAGLVTVVYNQKLLIDNKYLIVEFEQLSIESAIFFNWTLLNTREQSLQIQLTFERPLAVSVGKTADKLHVYVPIVIQGQKADHQNYFPVTSDVPKQLESLTEFETLTQTGESISKSASSLLWSLFVLSIFFGFALEMLWGAFQTLQIVLAMPLLAIKIPANVIVVFRGFSDVINLDVIDKQTIYDFTFGRFVPNKILESD